MNNVNFAAEVYASYLWSGHCFIKPKDYLEALRSIDENPVTVDRDYTAWKAMSPKESSLYLARMLASVVKRAEADLGMQNVPIGQTRFVKLGHHLVNEVSIAGEEIARTEPWSQDSEVMATIQTPFADENLLRAICHYVDDARTHNELARVATLPVLLPGVPSVVA